MSSPRPIITFRQKIALAIFGLFLFSLVIEIGLRIAGFIYLSLQERKNKAAYVRKGAYRILCLGDSNTALGGSNSYPQPAGENLKSKGPRYRICSYK